MPGPQIAKQIDFSKGIYANVNRFGQPPGTIHSASNYVFDKDGALQTVDGSLIISSLGGTGATTGQQPFRFIVRYAETGQPQRIYALQPTGTHVNVVDVSEVATQLELSLASSYDIPNAVQAGDTLAVALGRGTTPAILNNEPLVQVAPWINTWNAPTNIPQWEPNVTVGLGQAVLPTTANGHIYTAIQVDPNLGGITGATQPTWPTLTQSTVTDGTVIWREAGATSAPIPPGADFFFYHMGFLWAWGTNVAYDANNLDGPDALRMSDLNNFFSWNPLNASFLGKGDGTVAMGGAVMTLGEAGIAATSQIVLFKDTTSYIVLGALGPSAQIRQVPTGVGCVAPGTITFIEELGVVRLSERGITVFDGQNDSFEQLTAPIRAYLFGGLSDIMPVDWAHIRFAKACRVHNPPAYLLACPIVNFSQAKIAIGTVPVGYGAPYGAFSLPANLPAATSLYMTTSWNTSIWQTNTPNLATVQWAADTPAPPGGGTIYWIAAYGGAGSGALTRLFVYHIVLQAWAVVDLPFSISSLAFIPQNPFPAYTLCGGTSDGTIRRLFAGDQDWDGVPISGQFTIPELGNPVTQSYIREIAINGRAKFAVPCGFTGTMLQYTDRSGMILAEPLFIAPYQVPVSLDIDKTFVSGSVRFNFTGPMIVEGLEIAIQPKPFASWDTNRDGGYTTLNPPNGPPQSHGQTVPSSTYAQGTVGVGAGTTTVSIPLSIAPISTNYFASIAPTWDTTYWIARETSLAITVAFGTPAPAGGGLVAYNVIVTSTQNPVMSWPVGAGAFFTNITLTPPVTVPYVPVITPGWNTKFYITAIGSGGFTVAFDTPAPPGGGSMFYVVAVTQ